MQKLSIYSVSVLLYAIFIFAGTCFCLAALAFGGHFFVWRDLDFPVNLYTARDLLSYAGGAFAVGYGLYRLARWLLRASESDATLG